MKPIPDLAGNPAGLQALFGALDGPHVLVGVYDPADRLDFANGTFRAAFQLDTAARDMTFADVILHGVLRQCGARVDRGDALEFIAETQTRRRNQPGQRAFATDLVDGRWFWMTETLLESGWLVVIGTEFSTLRHGEQALIASRDRAIQEARTDALTGLANRRHSLSYLELAISAFVRAAVPLAIALVDLDHFKKINDTYGHAAGDAVLRDFAEVARKAMRQSDLIGRIGGEEFLMVFPGTSVDDAAAAVERIRCSLIGRRVAISGVASIDYSFSSGVCCVELTDDINTALERADRALYTAKRGGRNRVVSRRQGHA
ncbi:GGDEF domain-containing protein [Paraburkholderia sediminicola]|uniref:GGDEF domain-containing protein n=1 Tax=Paraburkholderia sediminicola TaxID=458836 RepID=UPI0038BB6EF6